MADRSIVISDFLFFLVNNWNNLEDETFVSNVIEFYYVEEVATTLKILKNDLEILKNYILKIEFKFCRNTTKRDTTLEYLSAGLARIPNVVNWLNLNFQMVKNDIKAMFSMRQKAIMYSWADRTKVLATNSINKSNDELDFDGFQLVQKAKKSKKSVGSPMIVKEKNSEEDTKKSEKRKQITYYGGNVGSCSRDIIENHLKTYNLAFNHCFSVLRKRNPTDNVATDQNASIESTAFKIILPIKELPKLTNPDIWPQYRFLREWDFSVAKNRKEVEEKQLRTIATKHGDARLFR
ncbi:hypothetical protein HELRODRAFT_158639 [Helobdella robusta]|uniref:Uncharacterized protein n=1 Tax=Helobdella robusta TaxID=6412 RepID=T1EN24_HELRO|nr:hypothetical protein HELRODRAFT_158639 [Helobdella robusta]ESO12177.1 hypothetical protein HELRODRAFT_158639 [Helobdella robusta]